MRSRRWAEHYRWMLPILLLAFLLRVACLDKQSLWWDEAMSVVVGSMDLHSSLENRSSGGGAAGFLYFLVLHFWLRLGQTEFVVRALSVIFGVLAVAALFPLANLVGGTRLGIISAFALAISPFHIWYSQEVRMYSLAIFLIVLSHYFFVRLLDEDKFKYWLGYGVFTLSAMYTPYIALFIIMAQMAYLTLMRRRYPALLRKWVLCMALLGLLYSPWLVLVFLQGGLAQTAISWIAAARPEDLFWTIYDFGLGSTSNPAHPLNILATVVLVAILAYVLFLSLRRKTVAEERNKLWFVWLWLWLPLVLIFVISLDWPLPQKRSVYMDRYLSPLVPAFLILVSYGMMQLFKRKKALGLLAATALFIPGSASTYALFFDHTYYRDQWREATTTIRENARSGDILLVRPHHYVPLYYYGPQDIPWFAVPYLESAQDYGAFLNAELPSRIDKGGRLWTMIVCENGDAHRFVGRARQRLMEKVEQDEVRAWLLQRYRLLEVRTYNAIHLSLYDTGSQALPAPASTGGN